MSISAALNSKRGNGRQCGRINACGESLQEHGFALVEILIAVTILSIILLSVFSGVSTSINAMTGNRNYSRAMLIARTGINEFIMNNMREPDVMDTPVKDDREFRFSRITEKYENPLLGALPAQKTTIIVRWQERGKDREYSLTYIYAKN